MTRSDGKAPPLLCNYLTTPHLFVHSASLASCSIPGVFEAVELKAKGRDGHIEPYFKTGGWTFTDGGLQADLPKERLTELFNVNQFIVSQARPPPTTSHSPSPLASRTPTDVKVHVSLTKPTTTPTPSPPRARRSTPSRRSSCR